MQFVMNDGQWSQYRSYADRVSVVVTPVEDQLEATDPDEFWLIETFATAWEQDWLVREVYQITARPSETGDVQPAPHWLDIHERRYSWGADSSAIEVLLFLIQAAATSAAWDATKLLARKMQRRLSDSREPGQELTLTDEEAERIARRALSARYGSPVVSEMSLTEIDIRLPSDATLQFASPNGWSYTCDLSVVGDDVTLTRVRRSKM